MNYYAMVENNKYFLFFIFYLFFNFFYILKDKKLQSHLASLLSSFRFCLLGLDVIRNGCLCRSFFLLFLYLVRPYFSFYGFYLHSISYESHVLAGFQEFNHCHFIYVRWRILNSGVFLIYFLFFLFFLLLRIKAV